MKRPIKVIKSNERQRTRGRGKSSAVKEAAKDPVRDMVRTVSDWIRESKRKRDNNSKLAFEDLFGG